MKTFFRPPSQTLVQAVRRWDHPSVDFKGLVRGPRPYFLIVINKYSCFPFVFLGKNAGSSTVVECLSSLFCILGFQSCVHRDQVASFVRQGTRGFLTERDMHMALRHDTTQKETVNASELMKLCGELSYCCFMTKNSLKTDGKWYWQRRGML